MTFPLVTPARRAAPASTLRRWTGLLLAVGTLLAPLSLFGSVSAVRAGLIVAVAAAFASCALAWREVKLERRAHAAATLSASRAHGEQLREERRHNAAVVENLVHHARQTAALAETRAQAIGQLSGRLGQLEAESIQLREDNAVLHVSVADRDHALADLQARLSAGENSAVTPAEEESAEVHRMPRRSLSEAVGWSASAQSDAELPNCLERRVVDLYRPEVAVVLPNYEGDRRFA